MPRERPPGEPPEVAFEGQVVHHTRRRVPHVDRVPCAGPTRMRGPLAATHISPAPPPRRLAAPSVTHSSCGCRLDCETTETMRGRGREREGKHDDYRTATTPTRLRGSLRRHTHTHIHRGGGSGWMDPCHQKPPLHRSSCFTHTHTHTLTVLHTQPPLLAHTLTLP